MLAVRDNLAQCFSALRAHKMRASLTMLGLTMGVATLITVMTIVQGANVYVEQKIANLGTNVFQIARTPFAVTDFNIIIKALKYKKIEMEEVRAVAEGCPACEVVGATASTTARARFGMVPLPVFLNIQGAHTSLIINVKTSTENFEKAQDQAQLVLRARRHITGPREADFFIGTKESYMSLWRSISSAFFAVFILVSAISVVIGGIVIMNVMLVSVSLRRREIGVRRAVGATKRDILRQFMVESVMQCIAGGIAGISMGFLVALALRTYTPFPASVQTWVAVMGVFLSSGVGLFFGIYPAVRASQLDPIVALRYD